MAAWTLIAALLTVIVIGLVGAMIIVRQVARPLGDLESQLDRVADGSVDSLTLPSQDQEIQSVVHHFNDMLKQLHSQQSRLRKHEKAAALGVLASGVAHELNNPLSNISTSVQLLKESSEPDEQERALWSVMESDMVWDALIKGDREEAYKRGLAVAKVPLSEGSP